MLADGIEIFVAVSIQLDKLIDSATDLLNGFLGFAKLIWQCSINKYMLGAAFAG